MVVPTVFVHLRGQRPRPLVIHVLVALALVVAACGGSDAPSVSALGQGTTDQPVEQTAFAVAEGADQPPLPHQVGRTIVGAAAEAQLAAEPSNELQGYLSPRVVPTVDGQALYYTSWDPIVELDRLKSFLEQGIFPGDPLGTPMLRRFDLRSGVDSVVAEGAYSVAVAASGRIAYARGIERDFIAGGSHYLTEIVVVEPDGSTSVWSDRPGKYIVAAWAGDALLAYIGVEESEATVLHRFREGEGPLALGDEYLTAISPDGRIVAVATTANLTRERAPDAAVKLVSIEDGSTFAELKTAELVSVGIQGLNAGGEWTDDTLVVPTSNGGVILDVGAKSVELRSVVRLGNDYLQGAWDAGLMNGDVVLWVTQPSSEGPARTYSARALRCAPSTRACVASASVDARDISSISNPSRPEGRS